MGVYLFRSVHEPWIKVGHHLACPRRPNPYFRIAGRGFHSVVHPPFLDGKLGMRDFVLEAWYPSLTRADEAYLHRTFPVARVGEFHPEGDLPSIIRACETERGGVRVEVSEAERRRAVAWAGKRAAKARRRRAA